MEPPPSLCTPFLNGATRAISEGAPLPTPFDVAGYYGSTWLDFSLLAMLTCALALVFVYFMSQLIRMPKLEAWTKFELMQLAITAIITLVMVGQVWAMCSWDVSILDTRYTAADYCHIEAGGKIIVPPYCVAKEYLNDLKHRGEDIFQILLTMNYGFHYLFKSVWESRPLGIGYTAEPLGGFLQLQNLFLVGVTGFMVSYLTTIIQQRILDYFLIAMPFFFMPLGIVLRSFSPTREFGGTLMAIVYASLLFYPLTIAMNDVLIFSDMKNMTTGTVDKSAFRQITDPANTTIGGWTGTSGPGGSIYDPMAAGSYYDSSQYKLDMKNLNSPQGIVANQQTEDLTYFMLWPYQMLMIYFVAAVMLPIINFMIYVEIARGFSKLIGSEVDLTNLTRLI